MKRRDFVKTSLCLGCAGALSAGTLLYNKDKLSDIETFLTERKFLYKSEKDLPRRIRLDICNLCQLNCAACWIRRDEELIKKYGGGFGYVTFEQFKDFVDKHPFINNMELSHNGEIFLNPDLEKIIKYAYEKNIILHAYGGVNLNTLTDTMPEALVKYNFETLIVSIDGATPETYSIYRRGGDFNKVMDNIKKINYYKEKYNSKYPIMYYQFILFGHNEHEIEKARELAKKNNMIIKYAVNFVENYSPVKNREKVLKLTKLKTLDSHTEYFFNLYKNNPYEWFFCKEFFESPVFNWNGEFLGCCNEYINTYGINVFKEGMLKALNDERILYAKAMLTNFKVKPRGDIPCSKCFVYDYLKEKNYPIKDVVML